MTIALCSTCGLPIVWATTRAGKAIPLDAEPVPDGNVAVSRAANGGGLVARVLAPGAGPRDGEARGRTHFMTCPQAAEHRRPR